MGCNRNCLWGHWLLLFPLSGYGFGQLLLLFILQYYKRHSKFFMLDKKTSIVDVGSARPVLYQWLRFVFVSFILTYFILFCRKYNFYLSNFIDKQIWTCQKLWLYIIYYISRIHINFQVILNTYTKQNRRA